MTVSGLQDLVLANQYICQNLRDEDLNLFSKLSLEFILSGMSPCRKDGEPSTEGGKKDRRGEEGGRTTPLEKLTPGCTAFLLLRVLQPS